MEGSSGSPWKKPFNSGALEDTFGVSERNPFSGEASQDSGFKYESDRVVLTQGDHLKNFGNFSGVAEDVEIDPFVCAIECGDISLRLWLDKPERSVDVFKCLQIFRQIVEIVHAAHSQGIVVHNVRPSCFVLEEDGLNSQVIEVKTPQSTCDMHQQRCLERVDIAAPVSLVEDTEENNMKAKRKTEELEGKKQSIPMKQVLLMEMGWYTSPEEVAGAPSSCASDIYQLGVLLFELFCPLSSREEKSRTMSSLRHRVLPPQLLLKWPKEASFCLWLVHPEPTSRPTSGELLHSEFLTELRDDTEEEREASIELRERIENQELLLEFLSLTLQKKGELAENLQQTVSFLCSDIEQVTQQQTSFKEIHGAGLGIDDCSESSFQSMSVVDNEDYSCLGTRKRGRPDFYVKDTEVCDNNIGDDQRNHGTVISKSSRLMKNFKKLESAYFLSRCKSAYSSGKLAARHSPIATDVGSFANKVVSKERSREGKSPWINPFLADLHKYLSFSELKVKADLKQGDLLQSSNLVCALSFDRDAEFFATASVNKKIKIFECDTTMNEDRDIHYPVVEMVSQSKLSSICWNTYIKSQIASSNFEGVVQLWDVTRNQVQSEMREHEQRIWSVDFSSADPTLLASGSDDGSVKLWSINQGVSVGTIKTKANVCCVQFPLDFARSLAFGSADHRIYYYDLRNLKMPVCTLVGHNKTVSYIKFVDNLSLVSASTDNTLKLWDLSKCVSRVIDSPIQSFTGHLNVKNFVGLSVSDGYIATGSETNEVFIYHKAFPMPALSFKFYDRDPLSGNEVDDSTQFISSVCWRGRSSTLVAANSTGNVKILEMF